MNAELEQITYFEAAYRQNQAARYLCAILAEELGNFNLARVQYNNMLTYPDEAIVKLAKKELYYLAVKENHREDLTKYAEYRGQPQYLKEGDTNYGSLVIIHPVGRAPVKVPRGTFADDPYCWLLSKAVS